VYIYSEILELDLDSYPDSNPEQDYHLDSDPVSDLYRIQTLSHLDHVFANSKAILLDCQSLRAKQLNI